MSFTNYWAKKVRANKGLKSNLPFRLKPQAFKKELEKAYEEGHKEGMRVMQQLADLSGNGGEIAALRKSIQDG